MGRDRDTRVVAYEVTKADGSKVISRGSRDLTRQYEANGPVTTVRGHVRPDGFEVTDRGDR